jgi:hypothetical protein
MSTKPPTHSSPEVLDETAGWLVGGGIVTVALFPFALPLILLTVAALLPLLVVPLVAGLLALPILVARRVGRWVIGALHPAPTTEPC